MNRVSLSIGAAILIFGIGLIPGTLNSVASVASENLTLNNGIQNNGVITMSETSLESLPTGQYYYVQSETSQPDRQRYVLLRKAGGTVIGVDGRSRIHACFRGFLKGDRIVDATRVFPPYQPDSRLDTQDELVDLSQYHAIEQEPTDEQAETLQTCMQFFWR